MRFFVSRNPKCLLMQKFSPFADPLRKSLLLVCLGALAGCASSAPQYPRYASLGGSEVDPRYGVRPSPRVIADGEEVPKGGGSFMVGKPYKIAGHTYYPSEKPYAATGTASWYGSDFHGRRTANGEIFDQKSISAAHPTLPLPSYARVTNLRNSRSIIVRVNDRGPYHGGRVMDVSQRVAEALDFHAAGTARVKVEWIGRANLAGDDDNKLLATLRDDGPATLEGGAPVMTASRREPERATAAAAPQAPATEPVSDLPRRADTEMMAYAEPARPDEGGETSAARSESKLDAAPVSSTRASKAEGTTPLPPVRPTSFGREATTKAVIRQAQN